MKTLNTVEKPLKQQTIDPLQYRRRKTRVVKVGSVGVGGNNPIRVQSMTITSTMNTAATVHQTKSLVDSGCEIVRITAPTVKEAKNLGNIKNELLKSGYTVPLAADIHFNPAAAMDAADFVEKVRINPGNYADGKMFKVREYTDEQYAAELQRIEDRFTPLVHKLKKLNKALRIGTNHGSLSDRIMNRFGDTPLGMVESALEFVRICRKQDYHDIIFSMKASNPRVMIAAYRVLADRLDKLGWDYPFHLGVTEAGDGEDGRIKSSVGIGSLLEDGIGDTIRVSLTEDPEFEIPVAQEIAKRYSALELPFTENTFPHPFDYVPDRIAPDKRQTRLISIGPITVGGSSPIGVVSHFKLGNNAPSNLLSFYENRLKSDTPPEILILESGDSKNFSKFKTEITRENQRLGLVLAFDEKQDLKDLPKEADAYLLRLDQKIDLQKISELIELCQKNKVPLLLEAKLTASLVKVLDLIKGKSLNVILCFSGANPPEVHGIRRVVGLLRKRKEDYPILLSGLEETSPNIGAIILGSLICDGIGDLICVSRDPMSDRNIQYSYNLLQACGSRLTKTEFVSCPSCGRTLFDLQTTTERIKSKTGHLKGVKIAIMGCIVNGPGEMADADFGYVGGGPGKINLYVGKTCVEKSIPSEIADQKLIDLIKSHGKWVQP